jgi:hypothetical protein
MRLKGKFPKLKCTGTTVYFRKRHIPVQAATFYKQLNHIDFNQNGGERRRVLFLLHQIFYRKLSEIIQSAL